MKFTCFFSFLIIVCFSAYAQKPDISFASNHIAIVVSNLDESASFYQDIMLMKEIKNETGNPKIRWFAFGDKRELHLLEGDMSSINLNKSIHLAISTKSLNKYVDYLKSLDYPFESWFGEKGKTNERPDGVEQIYLQDPDGYWIEINDDKL